MVGTTAALIGMGLMAGGSAAASIVSSSKQSGAAKEAAKTQEESTKYAADLQKQASDAALAFQRDVWNQQQSNQQPWINAGTWSLENLQRLLGPGGELAAGYGRQFEAPTGLTMENDPGYQQRLALGQQAIERSAAARGGALGGGALRSLMRYGQDFGSNEYQNVWNRARGAFDTNYNIWANDQGNKFNRMAALAGVGQQAVNTLGSQGSQAAGNVSNIYANMGNSLANLATQGGNARASGYVGSANAWGSGLNNISNNLMNLGMLGLLYGSGGGGGNGLSPIRINNAGLVTP